jgi:hypothetical protein
VTPFGAVLLYDPSSTRILEWTKSVSGPTTDFSFGLPASVSFVGAVAYCQAALLRESVQSNGLKVELQF